MGEPEVQFEVVPPRHASVNSLGFDFELAPFTGRRLASRIVSPAGISSRRHRWALELRMVRMIDPARLNAAYERVRDQLLAERSAAGHWVGELSTSALLTATAVSCARVGPAALVAARPVRVADRSRGRLAGRAPERGRRLGRHRPQLFEHRHHDAGAGGDSIGRAGGTTIRSDGRWAALHRRPGRSGRPAARYGRDRTFAVPILTNCALADLVSWSEVPALPFELACLPQRFYRFVRLPVVSYAIPALVAIGQARHYHLPSVWPWTRLAAPSGD